MDKALSQRVRAPPLDAGGDDDDADTGTDTTTPDDGIEDIASHTTIYISAALKLLIVPARSFGCACSPMHRHVLELEALFEDHGVCSGDIADSLALERVLNEQRALVQPLPSAL